MSNHDFLVSERKYVFFFIMFDIFQLIFSLRNYELMYASFTQHIYQMENLNVFERLHNPKMYFIHIFLCKLDKLSYIWKIILNRTHFSLKWWKRRIIESNLTFHFNFKDVSIVDSPGRYRVSHEVLPHSQRLNYARHPSRRKGGKRSSWRYRTRRVTALNMFLLLYFPGEWH